ncbi:hypothetical protein [Streptomyces doebereineriae]|uniref:Uncharacterized protein n=1 Tax=Streptomyces doebereineriae TaxID=3075528 RepID=A0ABU2VIN8_9ACTN|nr:hypothetical protein [Streptomyces sp. DSM 41640]MDT0485449.1 hypothetical protein [Streptomyces sp. DSM 41640]
MAIAFDSTCAVVMAATPAAAAARPRHPPKVTVTAGAGHDSLVCSAASCTAGAV